MKINVWDNNAVVASAAERGKAKETEFLNGEFQFSMWSEETMQLLQKILER